MDGGNRYRFGLFDRSLLSCLSFLCVSSPWSFFWLLHSILFCFAVDVMMVVYMGGWEGGPVGRAACCCDVPRPAGRAAVVCLEVVGIFGRLVVGVLLENVSPLFRVMMGRG